MEFLREVRNEFFNKMSQSRFKRILVITLFLALFWCGIDLFVHKELTLNIWHDLAVVVLATLVEVCIPWGKQNNKSDAIQSN